MIDDGLNLLLVASGDVGQKPNGLLKKKLPKIKTVGPMKLRINLKFPPTRVRARDLKNGEFEIKSTSTRLKNPK